MYKKIRLDELPQHNYHNSNCMTDRGIIVTWQSSVLHSKTPVKVFLQPELIKKTAMDQAVY